MTAQVSDPLRWKGKTYWVREFLQLPAEVEPPPEEVLVHDTSCWRGYTCRWEIRDTEDGPKLVLVGFQCDEYLPLYQAIENPITATVRVVHEAAECLQYVHMGFESKFEGERELIFEEGRLVGDRLVPDDHQNHDGLLDMAPLLPNGKEEGEQYIHSYLDSPQEQDNVNICYACGTSFALSRLVTGDNAICQQCWEHLYEIAKHMHHWKANAEYSGTAPMLSARVGHYGSPLVSPEWYRRSRLLGCAYFGFSPCKSQVVISFSGYCSFSVTTQLEFACENENHPHDERVACSAAEHLISKTLIDSPIQFDGLEVETSIRSYGGRASIGVTLTREFSIETASPRQTGQPSACEAAARDLEQKMEAAVRGWVSDLTRVARLVSPTVRDVVSRITQGTGIFPYNPVDLTPTDATILREFCWNTRRRAKTPWAIPPRHTEHGWVAGETIHDRYMSCLNI